MKEHQKSGEDALPPQLAEIQQPEKTTDEPVEREPSESPDDGETEHDEAEAFRVAEAVSVGQPVQNELESVGSSLPIQPETEAALNQPLPEIDQNAEKDQNAAGAAPAPLPDDPLHDKPLPPTVDDSVSQPETAEKEPPMSGGISSLTPANLRTILITTILTLLVIALTLLAFRTPKKEPAPAPKPAPAKTAESLLPDPGGIVLHDSASPAVVHGIPINAERLDEIHRRDHPNWATRYQGKTYYIGYHYVILPSGVIEKGRPDHCPGSHARRFNNWLGICVVGSFEGTRHHWWPSVPTPQQVEAVTRLCKELMVKYHITADRVKRHRDVNYTYCPGQRFPFNSIHQELVQFAMSVPDLRDRTPAKPFIASRGDFRPRSTRAN